MVLDHFHAVSDVTFVVRDESVSVFAIDVSFSVLPVYFLDGADWDGFGW